MVEETQSIEIQGHYADIDAQLKCEISMVFPDPR